MVDIQEFANFKRKYQHHSKILFKGISFDLTVYLCVNNVHKNKRATSFEGDSFGTILFFKIY